MHISFTPTCGSTSNRYNSIFCLVSKVELNTSEEVFHSLLNFAHLHNSTFLFSHLHPIWLLLFQFDLKPEKTRKWYMLKGLKELIWLYMSTKCTYFFGQPSKKNSKVKRAWTGVVEGCLTYQEVIRDIMWVKPKYKTLSYGDCRVGKQNFRASKKLMNLPSHGMGPTCQVNRCGRPIICGQ